MAQENKDRMSQLKHSRHLRISSTTTVNNFQPKFHHLMSHTECACGQGLDGSAAPGAAESAEGKDKANSPFEAAPLDKMMTTTASQRSMHMPSMPKLNFKRGTASCPSLQAGIRSASLDDASFSYLSLPTTTSQVSAIPYRNRSHAIDLMGLDLSCLKCTDDSSTGEHYLKAGNAKIHHPPHRKISSSSCVAFAVEAALAEQDEAAISEKAADDEEEDGEDDDINSEINSEIFGSDDFSCASGLESETSRVDKIKDDDFSFFCDFARSAADNNGNDGSEDIDIHQCDASRINRDNRVAVPTVALPTTPITPRNGTSRQPKVPAELSPVSVTTPKLNTTGNTAA